MAGTTYSFGTWNGDMYLLKLNANGYETWSYTFGGLEFEHGYRVVEADGGGFVMAGTTTSYGAGESDACLVKVDSTGALVWSHTYGGSGDEYVGGLAKTSDGGYILAGSAANGQNGTYDIYLVKTDADGIEDWSGNIDYDGYEMALGIVETTGGYALTGDRIELSVSEKIDIGELPGFTERMILARTDSSGNLKWLKEYGEYGAGLDIIRTSDGGYIMAGASDAWSLDPAEEDNGFAVKTDDKGIEEWSLTYDSPAEACVLRSVRQTGDGGYIFSGDQGDAALLLKCDNDGAEEWSRRHGGTGSLRSSGESVVEVALGGYCFAGSQYNVSTDDWSVYVVKTNSLGNTGLPLPVL